MHCYNTQHRAGGNSMMGGMTEDCLYLNVFTKNLIKRNNYEYDQVSRSVLNVSENENFKQGISTYAGNRQQTVSLPLRPVIVFLPGFENQGQYC